jgi:hypothetical protein
MAPSSPLLPAYNSYGHGSWSQRVALQLKLIRQNPGGGAAKRLLAVLLLAVVSALVVLNSFFSVSDCFAGGCVEIGPDSRPVTVAPPAILFLVTPTITSNRSSLRAPNTFTPTPTRRNIRRAHTRLPERTRRGLGTRGFRELESASEGPSVFARAVTHLMRVKDMFERGAQPQQRPPREELAYLGRDELERRHTASGAHGAIPGG